MTALLEYIVFGGPDKEGLTVSVRSMLPQKVRGAPAPLAPLSPPLHIKTYVKLTIHLK